MSKAWKTLIAVILVICAAATGWWISTHRNAQQEQPRDALPVIETNVLYDASITSADAPAVIDGGPLFGNQQDYRIHLAAGKTWMVETSMGWQDIGVSLYENGKRLDEASCGFRARCSFFVDTEKDVTGTLRIRGDARNSQEPLTIEVREVTSAFLTGKPSGRTGKLTPAPIPVIDRDGTFTGSLSASDSPLFWRGGGSLKDYQIPLTAGQNVLIKAKSSETDLGVALFAPDETLARKFAEEKNQDACIQVNVPADGRYTLRVMARDLNAAPAANYSLDVVRAASPEQVCPEE